MKVERLVYSGDIPTGFFNVGTQSYEDLSFSAEKQQDMDEKVCQIGSETNEIVFYTDHQFIRLVGIFPKDKTECFFGYWETKDDFQLNSEAFGLLEKDARDKHRNVIVGPLNFNTFHRYRLRIGDIPPWCAFDREPVNPLFYPSILYRLGFLERSRFESRYVEKTMVPDFYANKQKFLEKVNTLPVDIVPLSDANWLEFQAEIYHFVNETFGNNPSFKLISEDEFGLLYNLKFAEKLCPYSSVLFTDKKNGKIAALSFCQPNYQTLNIRTTAATFKRDFAKLDKKTLLIKTVGVHPHYRNMSLMSYLGAYAMQSFNELYEDAIFCLMRSDNVSTNFTRGLPYVSATYVLFEKKLS